MKRKMSRRGVVSHVGVVLSFVIFVTFILFIYVIVKPAVGTESKQNLLNYIKDILVERFSAELTSVSVLIDEGNPCVQLNDFFNKVEIGNRVIVRNNVGGVFDAEISGQNLIVKGTENEKFLKIYGSEEFDITDPGTSSCQPLNEGSSGYIFGLIRSEKNIFEKKIIQIIGNYSVDYESLKEELNIASGNDFRLDFIYANKTIISTEEKEVLVDVFVDEFQIQYISKDAAKELGSLNVGIW